ncbi:hypothetical protein TYRP_015462 [Tyrophagus putrescentiae]|nr:hypothetical protein TYRP_015462 [Tyrophagus putrescentiae]
MTLFISGPNGKSDVAVWVHCAGGESNDGILRYQSTIEDSYSSEKVVYSNFNGKDIASSDSCSFEKNSSKLCINDKKIVIKDGCKGSVIPNLVSGYVSNTTAYLFDTASSVYVFNASAFTDGQSVDLAKVGSKEAWTVSTSSNSTDNSGRVGGGGLRWPNLPPLYWTLLFYGVVIGWPCCLLCGYCCAPKTRESMGIIISSLMEGNGFPTGGKQAADNSSPRPQTTDPGKSSGGGHPGKSTQSPASSSRGSAAAVASRGVASRGAHSAPPVPKTSTGKLKMKSSPPVTVFVARTIKEKKAQLKAAGKQ